ncbi:MAG TPA: EAL domain-containing protein [Gammaproteobacteria bacterium]|nr:EAL domain-containing protein [Gammaproteobacteria bacterium]
MPERTILPILVASKTQNVAEHLNGLLRTLGMRVRSEWGGDAEALDLALSEHPELVFFVADEPPLELADLVKLRDRRAADAPIIALKKKSDSLDIAEVMSKGARDLVHMENTAHIKAVIERELPVARMAAQLQRYADALADYEKRLGELLKESADAIAYLQDGIHMRANPAYLALFGYASADDIEGIPVMDVFDADSQGTLKTAIQQAVKKGNATDDLELKGVNAKGETFPATISLAPEVVDGEPCIRLAARVAQLSPELEEQLGEREREAAALKASLADIRHRDPLTGVYHRAYFLEQLRSVKTSDKAIRALALVTADQFAAVEATVGAYASGRIISSMVELVNASVNEGEPVGRFDDDTFAIVLSRRSLDDIGNWATKLCKLVSDTVFEAGTGSTSMTCSIGIAEMDALADSEVLLSQALEASQSAVKQGGNRHVVYQPADVNTEAGESDASWVKRITDSLKNDKLQLVFQPIASLDESEADLQDVLVKMRIDNNESLPAAKFIPHAERLNLMPAIDKWVVRHLLPFVAGVHKKGRNTRFFVRLSPKFLLEPNMLKWLTGILQKAPSLPVGSLIFQFPEAFLDKHLKESKDLIEALNAAHCAISIAQFGLGRNSLGVLDHLRPDFIKLSDKLVGGILADEAQREKVNALIDKAKSKKIETIAQRVESADIIAILWQMGVQYVQGNYLQEPGAEVSNPVGKARVFGH